MGKKCIRGALIVLVSAICLCVKGQYIDSTETHGETLNSVLDSGSLDASDMEKVETKESKTEKVEAEPSVTQVAENATQMQDLTEAFDVILRGATKEFIAGYAIDHTFLMWLEAQYGADLIIDIAYCVLDNEMDSDIWYEKTGNSMHVLWLQFCQDSGFQRHQLKHVYWQETAEPSRVVLSFTGDFNFAKNWYTTEYMERQPNGLEDCFSEDLLEQMRGSDILIMNNEFTYMEEHRADALPGKAYTFRAEPEMVELLEKFGVDGVTLANNHVYDYGETGLLDTMQYLNEAEIPYVGAGEDIKEASEILYYVANGRKIAIVAATQIERSTLYTKEATETEAGVLKTLHPGRFLQVIEQADANSDYVIALVHWGTEGTLFSEESQRILADQYVQAGADAIIGAHPHRLQGVAYYSGIPTAYSLGNFWFSNGTLYTTVAQIIIEEDGSLQMRFVPCVQEQMVTRMLTEQDEKDGFYHYLASISSNIGIDQEGNVYDKSAEAYPADIVVYDSERSTTPIRGSTDNEGNAIDIVGNLK